MPALLAAPSRRTSLSVGSYCGEERRRRVSAESTRGDVD
jgi:hypothetical protein